MTRLSVVIPALNEASRLPPSLRAVAGYLVGNPQWMPAEIVVVDDGSGDGTAVAARAVNMVDGIDMQVFVHSENRGKGAAVRTGFAASTGEMVLLSDADLATPIEELDVLAKGIPKRGVAIGSRAVDRGLITSRQPRYRDLMGRMFNLVVRLLVFRGISDTQCGFKLFSGELARALAGVQRIEGFAYDVEHLVLAHSWGRPIREIAVRWHHVEASRVAPIRHSSQMIRDLVRIWWWRAAGRLAPPPEDGR